MLQLKHISKKRSSQPGLHKKARKSDITFVVILLLTFVVTFHNLLFELPNGIHEWAQADRLALAYGFFDNGMNFFKPSTFSQFSENGVTGVEFPIQAYLSALFAKVIGREYISIIYRLLDTTIIATCLFLFFRIVFSLTKNFILALLPIAILLSSPTFLHYTCNFMPDTVALGILLVGMGLYLQIWLQNKGQKRKLAIGLCTLATLIKTSAGIYLIGFFLYDMYYLYFESPDKRAMKSNMKYISLSLTIIIAYFLYNRYLNEKYHSGLFLFSIKPINSDQFIYFVTVRFPKVWMREYFILPTYILLSVMFIYLIVAKNTLYKKIFLPLLGILIIGIFIVSLLMGAQFIDHDYYVIPIFFPFLALITIWFSLNIRLLKKLRLKYTYAIIAVSSLFLIINSIIQTRERLSSNYDGFSAYYNTEWLKNGAQILNAAKIPKDAKIGVLSEWPPNLSLVYFDRKGFALNKDWWGEKYESAFHFFQQNNVAYGIIKIEEFDRIAIQDNSFPKFFDITFISNNFYIFKTKVL